MKHSKKVGFSFGSTSGIITTMGLIVGLYTSINSKFAVLGGIFTIAIADAFSDALGIHMAEESQNKYSNKEIWQATLSTFFTKFIFALSFAVPFILLPLAMAFLVSILWGIFLLIVLNYFLAKQQKKKPLSIIKEHVFIALIVIILTSLASKIIKIIFNS